MEDWPKKNIVQIQQCSYRRHALYVDVFLIEYGFFFFRHDLFSRILAGEADQ